MTYVYRRAENITREPVAPYVYREDIPHHARNRPKPQDFNPDLCGTTKGYWQHRQFDQSQCPGCAGAYSEYLRGYRERNPEKGGRKHARAGREGSTAVGEARR